MNREESLKAVGIIYRALDSKLAMDIKIIDISEVSTIADYFVIASGSNENQTDALVENVDYMMSKAGHQNKNIEGFRRGGWTLLDFGDIVVHVFDTESREFYNIERIWKDGITLDNAQFAEA